MELSSDNESNKLQTIFYGTRICELVIGTPLDPDFNAEKVFEYGNGVYFTDDEKTSRGYIVRNSIVRLAKSKTFDIENGPSTLFKTGKLHVYKLEYNVLRDNEDGCEAFDKYLFRKELKMSVKGYKKEGIKKGYKPIGRYFTSGYLAGKVWDTYWDSFFKNPTGNLKYLGNKEIERLLNRCTKNKLTINQICIHKRTETSNDNSMKYFDEKYFKYIKSIDVKYVEEI